MVNKEHNKGIVSMKHFESKDRKHFIIAHDYYPCKVHVLAPHKTGVALIRSSDNLSKLLLNKRQ